MKVWQFIRPDVTAAALAHLLILALIVLFSEVHPFGSVASQPIAVDLVTPDEIEKASEATPTPTPTPTAQPTPSDFSQLAKPETAPASPSPAPQPAEPRRQAAEPLQAALQPQSQPPPATPAPSPGPGYTALPPAAAASSGKAEGDGFDATASSEANISSSVISDFRRHLKSCSKLPASITPSDRLVVKLRVQMTPDGRLASDPMVAGGSANPKALDLLQSAVQALRACQPYTMLPTDRYGEWKVLDLNFTPRDFSS
jgi:hypothetical protein